MILESRGEISGLEEHVEPEEDARLYCLRTLQAPSAWQRIIHGATSAYRLRVVMSMIEEGQLGLAERFALCGRGDLVLQGANGYRIQPMRCGSRLCPRCSRHRGQKYVAMAFERLRKHSHQWLYHVVLTQPVLVGESLKDCRVRLIGKWKGLGDRKRFGLVGGLLTEHIKWSRFGGWHVHLHLIGEFETDAGVVALRESWKRVGAAVDGRQITEPFWRVIAVPGEAVLDLDDGQGELWGEAKTAVAVALQYAVRDVCEGASAGNVGLLPEKAFTELVALMGNVKLHRRLGVWREAEFEEEEDGKVCTGDVPDEAGSVSSTSLGTVDSVFRAALDGGPAARGFCRFLMELSGGSRSPMCVRTRATLTTLGLCG